MKCPLSLCQPFTGGEVIARRICGNELIVRFSELSGASSRGWPARPQGGPRPPDTPRRTLHRPRRLCGSSGSCPVSLPCSCPPNSPDWAGRQAWSAVVEQRGDDARRARNPEVVLSLQIPERSRNAFQRASERSEASGTRSKREEAAAAGRGLCGVQDSAGQLSGGARVPSRGAECTLTLRFAPTRAALCSTPASAGAHSGSRLQDQPAGLPQPHQGPADLRGAGERDRWGPPRAARKPA